MIDKLLSKNRMKFRTAFAYAVLCAVLVSGCNKMMAKKVPLGLCVQKCVNDTIEMMARSDNNNFTPDIISKIQTNCEQNLQNSICYGNESDYFAE